MVYLILLRGVPDVFSVRAFFAFRTASMPRFFRSYSPQGIFWNGETEISAFFFILYAAMGAAVFGNIPFPPCGMRLSKPQGIFWNGETEISAFFFILYAVRKIFF